MLNCCFTIWAIKCLKQALPSIVKYVEGSSISLGIPDLSPDVGRGSVKYDTEFPCLRTSE